MGRTAASLKAQLALLPAPRFAASWSRRGRGAIVIAAWAAVPALAVLGSAGRGLFETPDIERFLEFFFKEPFLLILGVSAAWVLAARRPAPGRAEEFRWLNTLPLDPSFLHDRLLLDEMRRFAWVPGLSAVAFMGLTQVCPFPHLARLAFFAFEAYILFQTLRVAALAGGPGAAGRSPAAPGFPASGRPVADALAGFGYVVFLLSAVVLPSISSGWGFWMSALVLASAAALAVAAGRARMAAAQAAGAAFRASGDIDRRRHAGRGAEGWRSAFVRLPSWINPWLIETALRGRRESRPGSWLLAGAFTAAAYLLAMNNKTAGDRAQVLFALNCGFSFAVALCAMNWISPDREPPEWVHGLPARKTDLAVSFLASGLSILAPVTAAFLVLLTAAGTSLPLLAGFLAKSSLSALLFLWPACAYGLRSYPDPALGRRRFFTWTLGLILLSALFYKYHVGILPAMAVLPVLDFRRARLYRSADP